MSYLYCASEFERKMGNMKGILRNNGFYSTPIIARVKVVTGGSGIYNRNATTTFTDTIVSGIAEYGPTFVTYEEVAQTIDGDVRFTCSASNKATIDNADELWLRVDIIDGVIQYDPTDPTQFTQGTMYKINSSKPSLYELDEIYILRLGGEQS
jgi:hypothetical protein